MTQRFVQTALLMFGAVCALAQTPPVPASSAALTQSLAQVVTGGSSNEANAVNYSMLLSNKAVVIVSGLRGIDASAVKLRFGDPMSGRFEIPVEGARDLRREAELLSKDFGADIAVIVDQATADGRLRTNYVFRNGSMRRTVAPVGKIGLPPGGQRMYVWPETSRLTPPANVRVREQVN